MKDVFSKLKKVNFVPVVAAAVLEATYAEKYMMNGKQCDFASKDAVLPYDKCLVNPVHGTKNLAQAFLKMRDDVIIFSDSGGLQALTLNKKTQTPEEVVLWQEENCHIGFSYDSIPFTFDDNVEGGIGKSLNFDVHNFIEHAEKSALYLKQANAVRTNPDFKLYAIIQGRKYDEYVQWLKILSSEKVDGYCVKCPSNDPVNMAESCLFALFNLDKPIHFLGVENFSRSVVCCYISQYFKHPITFDGSAWAMGARIREYRLPFALTKSAGIKSDKTVEISEDGEEMDVFSDLQTLDFCCCPACREVTNVQELINDKRLGILLSLHNMYQTVMRTNLLCAIIKDRKLLRSFIRSSVSEGMANRLENAFDFIDLSISLGYRTALEKYQFLLTPNKDTIRQSSILDL